MSNQYPHQYGQPPNQFQQQWQQGPPPPQQFGGYPPQGGPPQQWGPPQQHFQGGPPSHNPYPNQHPPQQHNYQQGHPPQGNYPPPHQPPQGQLYSQPQGFGAPPSPGYIPGQAAQGDARNDVNGLNNAMSGFRRDHTMIIRILTKPDPLQIALLRDTYSRERGGASLEEKVSKDFRNHYGETLVACVRGPLLQDVHNVKDAINGVGTKESMLNDVLIGRTNADLRAIKQQYSQTFRGTSLESDVSQDLSFKTKDMFNVVMRATRNEETAPVIPQETTNDAQRLYSAMNGLTKDQEIVYNILLQRSDGQIRAIAQEYQRTYHTALEEKLKSKFDGHMKDALLLALARATDRAKCDADSLEDSMKGIGTKDVLLLNRIVRLHWNRPHTDQVKRAYQHFYKKDLVQRVRSETSGDYRDALVSCLT